MGGQARCHSVCRGRGYTTASYREGAVDDAVAVRPRPSGPPLSGWACNALIRDATSSAPAACGSDAP